MTAYALRQRSLTASPSPLSEWEKAVIDLFLNAANSGGLPKSVGQIYGLLFCRDEPLAMDEIMDLLSISKGSASQGLRSLRQLVAVKSQYLPGQRKEHFVAEIRLRKLVAGFLKEQAEPHLQKGEGRLRQLRWGAGPRSGQCSDSRVPQKRHWKGHLLQPWLRLVLLLMPSS